MRIIIPQKKNLKIILNALNKGKTIICPTDTVYGIICDANNGKAVKKIFKIKKRKKDKPLPVFVENIKTAKKFAYINKKQEEFLEDNWPGPLTAVLRAKKGLSKLVYKDGTIALRAPNYEFLNLILKKFKKPIAQTSANISGKPATTKIKQILKMFKNQRKTPDIVLNIGNLPKNKPSKIIDLTKNKLKILRK